MLGNLVERNVVRLGQKEVAAIIRERGSKPVAGKDGKLDFPTLTSNHVSDRDEVLFRVEVVDDFISADA